MDKYISDVYKILEHFADTENFDIVSVFNR